MRVFVDFHHSSLLRSHVLLFEKRLGMEVYRPIGMDWYYEGYWAVNGLEETAEQFLGLGEVPADGTVPLNDGMPDKDGTMLIADPGDETYHRACTLKFFMTHQFDYLVASLPQHIPIFEKLIKMYQSNAKLIVQLGNDWPLERFEGYNVLASTAPRAADGVNTMFYHQEFDLDVFCASVPHPTKKIYSFVNCLPEIDDGSAYLDYRRLKALLEPLGFEFRSYGGQCPDGNMTGPRELAEKMSEAQFIFHVKPGGDGFGHIIHNAYAVGRPIITRRSHYRGKLADLLMVEGTVLDLDTMTFAQVAQAIVETTNDPSLLAHAGISAAKSFERAVEYEQEAKNIASWLVAL